LDAAQVKQDSVQDSQATEEQATLPEEDKVQSKTELSTPVSGAPSSLSVSDREILFVQGSVADDPLLHVPIWV